jgi:S1-C subfamily serine protease
LAKHYTPGKSIVTTKPVPIAGLRVDYASALYLRDPPGGDNGHIPAGVFIREILPNSPAHEAKLQMDQIITRVNGLEVNSPPEFYASAAKDKAKLTLTIIKADGRPEEITLKLR